MIFGPKLLGIREGNLENITNKDQFQILFAKTFTSSGFNKIRYKKTLKFIECINKKLNTNYKFVDFYRSSCWCGHKCNMTFVSVDIYNRNIYEEYFNNIDFNYRHKYLSHG